MTGAPSRFIAKGFVSAATPRSVYVTWDIETRSVDAARAKAVSVWPSAKRHEMNRENTRSEDLRKNLRMASFSRFLAVGQTDRLSPF